MSVFEDVPHPGMRIKTEVIPSGMSVTDAAKLIGVGRPALSNLLNGNAALSADMAARLEKAFNYPRHDLLEMQARYEAAQAKKKNAPADTRAYVPPFLGIKANQIEQWAGSSIGARTRFAVLLRTLVHSTGRALTNVDFPGNDDAERPGWDGFVEAGEGTPWVPVGRSGWEFGVGADIKAKADSDFRKSVKALDEDARKEITFIFVTPRRWPESAKTAWIASAKAQGRWKDVRAYDGSDLEQWFEQSIPAQVWFSNETFIPAQDVRSLDKCWADWANVSDPPLTGSLFGSAIDAAKRAMSSYLLRAPDGPIVIAADSTEEALAFLSVLFGGHGEEDLIAYRGRILVFDKPGIFPRLAEGAQTFIPVAFSRAVERELAPYTKAMPSIVVYPRNVARIEPHIVLEPATYETFNKALQEMGKDRDEITRLSNASGRSLTVLRRALATMPAVRTPEWAEDYEAALIPFLFVGAWNSANETDQAALSLLAGDRKYSDLERECQRLVQINDAPVWSIGSYRGVISKIDLLYAIAGFVTTEDLRRYFSMARMVLGEDDPALDLEEEQRWAAAIHGKTREFSSAFREGMSETLVLLAVHGGQLFKDRLGIDTELEARLVVRDLLPTPLTTRILEANDRDLPTYAEAAPEEFLSIIEQDLNSDAPAVLGLLRPVGAGVFGRSPSRTGLLWALEGLSWNPETLPRAAFILARLAQVEINDNWVNKPAHSLESIFRAWMPQTAADHDARVNLMRGLLGRFPNVVWKICVSQFGSYRQVGDYSHKPRWRPDGYGFGEPMPTWGPILAFKREMVEMALNWKEHTLDTIGDLVERLYDLDADYQARVWVLVEAWARGGAGDIEKSTLREKIRMSVLSRRAVRRAKKSDRPVMTAQAKAAYAALEPKDLLNKHAWLFRDTWVEESADELEEIEDVDYQRRDERIQALRVEAMREIFSRSGLAGLMALAERGKASWHIGILAARDLLSEQDLLQLLRLAIRSVLQESGDIYPLKNLISGALRALSDSAQRERILKMAAADLREVDIPRLLVLAPYGRSTWELVDALGEEAQAGYWSEVVPDWIRSSDEENNEGVERLLKAGRPRAAFSCIRFHPEKLDAQNLFRLLNQMAQDGNDRPGEYLLDNYNVEKAFEHINGSPLLTLEDKAGLEFAYVEMLARPFGRSDSGYGIPNLEKYIEAHPELFVQAVAWSFRRNDEGSDPVEMQVPQDRIQVMAERGYKLIESIERIPGHDAHGELKADRLARWIATVRQAGAGLSRADTVDLCLGKLLANAPIGEDGIWPCEPVRQVMEEIHSDHLMQGAHTAVYNARGAHWRGEGGDQERELADKYRKWGQALLYSYPFVASNLLMGLAKTYEREASREDTAARLRRRLR